jgi:hypothetical protein
LEEKPRDALEKAAKREEWAWLPQLCPNDVKRLVIEFDKYGM